MSQQPPPLGDPANRIDLPFEANPPGQTIPGDDIPIAGGLIIAGTLVEVGGHRYGGLIFRFMDPHGEFLQAVHLVADDAQLRQAVVLVDDAVRATLDAVERAR